MAKKKKVENPQTIKSVEQTLTKTEQYLEENYRKLLTGLAIVVGLVAIFWLSRMYLGSRNDEAQSQMYQAERYLEADSIRLALYGDGNYLGFIDIADDYKFTHAGNLARYAAGICFLRLGEYEEAISYLNKYSKKDKVIGSLAIGAIGDAYVEMGDQELGIKKYIEAAEYASNDFNTPLFLMKAGEIHEMNGNYSEALKLYERIKTDYPESSEGSSIDKYIARARLLVN